MNRTRIEALLTAVLLLVSAVPLTASAEENADASKEALPVKSGTLYEFDKGTSRYVLSSASSTQDIQDADTFGEVTVSGSITQKEDVDGIDHFQSDGSGTAEIHLSVNSDALTDGYDGWTCTTDEKKSVAGVDLDGKIGKGVLIVQISRDGTDWITESVQTDLFSQGSIPDPVYETEDIQQLNGCWYRLILAYRLQKSVGTSQFLWMESDDIQYRQQAEVYEFFVDADTSEAASADAKPRQDLTDMSTVRNADADKDTGYTGNNAVTGDDPHNGWEIGQFFLNGYQSQAIDPDDGKTVYIKRESDQIALWFDLKQDINALNGNDDLTIEADTDGYSGTFHTDQGNPVFRHGALIIRCTDWNNMPKEPVIYTDFLAADARKNTETLVGLYGEGDYDAELDYEVKDSQNVLDAFSEYHRYRISFSFSVRNDDCMIYPKEISTEKTLGDYSFTENGFQIDDSNSKYLQIDFRRTVLSDRGNGKVLEDKESKSAEIGKAYTEEGLYTITAKNRYTGAEEIVRHIYVGRDPLMKAYVTSGCGSRYSIQDIEDMLDPDSYKADLSSADQKALEDAVNRMFP